MKKSYFITTIIGFVLASNVYAATSTITEQTATSALDSGVASLVSNFGTGGMAKVNIGSTSNIDSAKALTYDSESRLIVVGNTSSNTDAGGDFAIARFNTSGDLDTTFGDGDGMVTVVVNSEGDDTPTGVLVDASDNIIIFGESSDSTGATEYAVVRLTSNGSLDTTFGGDGIVTTTVTSGADNNAYGAAIDSSGNIVVVGSTGFTGEYDFAVVRYTSVGDLDSSFGTGGIVTTDMTTYVDVAYAVAIDSSDRIVVAGVGDGGGDSMVGSRIAVARYSDDGSLDTGFSGDGKVGTPLVSLGYTLGEARAVAIDSSNKVIVAGDALSSTTGNRDYVVVRYTAFGTADSTFNGDGNTDGIIIQDLGSSLQDRALALRVTSSTITLGGFTGSDEVTGMDPDDTIPASYAVSVAQFTSTGALDTTFDTDGLAVGSTSFSFDYGSGPNRVGFKEDSLVAITYTSDDGIDMMVNVNAMDGSPDTVFSTDGQASVDFIDDSDDVVRGMVRDNSGRILLVGTTGDSSNGKDFAIVRFTADGVVDTDFGGGDGIVTIDFDPATTNYAEAYDVAVDSSGRIYVVGKATISESSDQAILVRLNDDGSIDTDFGENGIASEGEGTIYALALNSSGSITLGGTLSDSLTTIRYDATGAVESDYVFSFNIVTGATTSSSNVFYDLALTSDGGVVLVGCYSYSGHQKSILTKFDSAGDFDTSFGDGGKVTQDFGGGSECLYSLAIDNDGKIIAVGYAEESGSSDRNAFVARFNADGEFDTAGFGSGSGFNEISVASLMDSTHGINDVAVDSVGKIWMSGSLDSSVTGYDWAIYRFESNGDLDVSFGADSVVTYDSGDNLDDTYAYLAFDDENHILLGGTAADGDFAVLKINAAHCGDSIIDSGETCDDGNITRYDGCSDTCSTETDGDGDGYYVGADCDDANASAYPGAAETCGDGVDQSCDGSDTVCAVSGDTDTAEYETSDVDNDTDANIDIDDSSSSSGTTSDSASADAASSSSGGGCSLQQGVAQENQTTATLVVMALLLLIALRLSQRGTFCK